MASCSRRASARSRARSRRQCGARPADLASRQPRRRLRRADRRRAHDRASHAGAVVQRPPGRKSEDRMTIQRVRAQLEGRKALVVGIANGNSIAWGCAKWLRALGADVAVTYLNEKAKKFVEPLAKELEAPIFVPLNVNEPGQMEAVFEHIG